MDKGILSIIFAVFILLFMFITQWENVIELDWRRLLLIGGGVCIVFIGVFITSIGFFTPGFLLILGGSASSFVGFALGSYF